MMGRISMGSDLLRAHVVPLLNWTDPKTSTVILHLSFLAAGATVLVYQYVPWNLVLLVGGVGGIFAAHPWFLSLLGHLERSPEHRATVETVKRTLERIMANDALPDDVLDAPHLVTIRCVEHERFREGTWSHDHLDVADPPAWSKLEGHGAQGKRISGPKYAKPLFSFSTSRGSFQAHRDVEPPAGFEWIEGEGWLIDFAHKWGREGIDPEGWTVVGPPSLGPSLRQRRWLRRAFDRLPPV